MARNLLHRPFALAVHQGRLWIGSDVGVELRRADGSFERIPSPADRPTGIVQELAVGIDGTLWIASARGLRCVRPGVEYLVCQRAKPFEKLLGMCAERVERCNFHRFIAGP